MQASAAFLFVLVLLSSMNPGEEWSTLDSSSAVVTHLEKASGVRARPDLLNIRGRLSVTEHDGCLIDFSRQSIELPGCIIVVGTISNQIAPAYGSYNRPGVQKCVSTIEVHRCLLGDVGTTISFASHNHVISGAPGGSYIDNRHEPWVFMNDIVIAVLSYDDCISMHVLAYVAFLEELPIDGIDPIVFQEAGASFDFAAAEHAYRHDNIESDYRFLSVTRVPIGSFRDELSAFGLSERWGQ